MSSLLLLCTLLFTACQDKVPAITTGQSEVIYFNGNIYTVKTD